MAQKHFTDGWASSLQPTLDRQEWGDAERKCLQLHVQAKTSRSKEVTKTFVWRGRINGQLRKIVLGRFSPDFKVRDARREAQKLNNEVAGGGDPYGDRKRAKVVEPTVITVDAAFKAYMENEGQYRKSADAKWKEYYREIQPLIGSKPIAAVTSLELAEIVNNKARAAPVSANRLHALLSRFFRWSTGSKGWGATGLQDHSNPMARVERPSEIPEERERTLDEQEIVWLLKACEAIRNQPRLKGRKQQATPRWAAAVEILLRTGQRRSDILNAIEEELEGECLVLPGKRHKSGKRHLIYLNDRCRGLLGEVPRPQPSSKRFFQCLGSDETNLDRIRAKMEELAGQPVQHWTLHDLRRTCASRLADMIDEDERPIASTDEIKKLLGHKLKGAIAAYLHHDAEKMKRRLIRVWNSYLDGLLSEKELALAA